MEIVKDKEFPETLSAGDEIDVQIAPLGDWPQNVNGKIITQRVDAEAVSRICAAYDGEVLVDADHAAENGGSTEAMAWITGLRDGGERGILATFRFTDAGADAVSGRRYRFVSPAWMLGADGRPSKLVSCAFTNKPNLPVAPVINSGSGATAADEPENERNPKMDKIKESLGLTPEATDDDVAAAIDSLRKRIEELTAEKNEAEAEKFAEENKEKVCNSAALKAAYLKDKALAREMVANIRDPAMGRTVVNAAAAKAPALNVVVDHLAVMNSLPPSKRAAYYADHKAQIDQ